MVKAAIVGSTQVQMEVKSYIYNRVQVEVVISKQLNIVNKKKLEAI